MTGREDGGPIDPSAGGDWESAVEAARAAVTECPCCADRTVERETHDGLRCANPADCGIAGGWTMSDDDLVRDWAEALDDGR